MITTSHDIFVACFIQGKYDGNKGKLNNDINDSTNYGRTGGKRSSAIECQILCQRTPQCKYFTWSHTEENCWVLSEYKSLKIRNDFTSGPMSCERSGNFRHNFIYLNITNLSHNQI